MGRFDNDDRPKFGSGGKFGGPKKTGFGSKPDGFKKDYKPRGESGGFGDKPRFNSDDRPKRSFGDKPSGTYGAKSSGFKKDFKPRGEGGGFGDKPRFNSDDRPKRSFGDKPSGTYGAKSGGFKKDFKPRGEGGGFGDKPRFNSDDRPKRSFGDKPSGTYGAKSGGFKKDFKPRGEGGGFGDKPRFNSDDRPKRSFGDKPSGTYGAKSGGFKKDFKPRGEGGGFGDKPRFNSDDRPKRSFEDKPKRTFGEKPSGFKKDFEKGDGFEKKPRTGYLKKPDGPFGVQPSFFKKSESEDAPKTTRFSSQDSEKRGLGRKSFRKDSGSDEIIDAPKSRFSNSDESKPRFTENNMGKKPKLYSKKKEEFFSKNEVETVHKHKEREPKPLQEDGIRLNRFIANSGVCSRREADVLIQDGMIKINGKVVDTLGYIVKDGDTVKYGSKILNREKMVYVLLNKPKDFITSTTDPQERETVMQLVKNACKERIYPVGRLDRATTGLLLLTNDGELTEKLTHPSHNVKKIYQLELDRPISVDDANAILEGLYFEEGKAVVDSMAVLDSERKTVGIEIHIGWNRIVRRMFEAKGYDVVKLDRVLYAGLTKKDLPRGHWKHLTEKEVVMLKHFN